jgi:hypothetical protein
MVRATRHFWLPPRHRQQPPVLMNDDGGISELVGAVWPTCTSIVRTSSAAAWATSIANVLREPEVHFRDAEILQSKVEAYLHERNLAGVVLDELFKLIA